MKKAHSRQSCSLRGRLLGTRGCGRAAVLSGARAARRPAWPAGPGAPGGVRAPRSCDCGASRRQATALGTAGTADWRRSPGFSEEEAYLLVLERQPEGRAAGWLPPRGHTGRSGTRWAGAIFARFLLPGQACVHDSGARVLATAAQGTPPDRLALEASGAYACNATALCVFAFFKSCLRTWWPLTEVLPFGTETGLGTAPTTGSP